MMCEYISSKYFIVRFGPTLSAHRFYQPRRLSPLLLINTNRVKIVINSTDMYRKEAGHSAQVHMVGPSRIALAKALRAS